MKKHFNPWSIVVLVIVLWLSTQYHAITSKTFDAVKNKATAITAANPTIVYKTTLVPNFNTWSQACVDIAKTSVYNTRPTDQISIRQNRSGMQSFSAFKTIVIFLTANMNCNKVRRDLL